MKYIKLTKGFEAIVDDEDYEYLNRLKWCISYSSKTVKYAARRINGIKLYLHFMLIDIPKNHVVDHINRNTLDNRKENLRTCHRAQNTFNRDKNKNKVSSQYKGVFWDKEHSQFKAQISFNKKQIWLGRFKTEKEAALAYNKKAKELFGKFAFLNEVLK